MKWAYYNEWDAQAASWLRELIRAGHLPEGEVDERSIFEVDAADLAGFRACHFFAGIGGWPYALRLAGWPDEEPVWTGSPPCQPVSVAGLGLARDDERHLAPVFLRLVRAARPAVLFGEQVASSSVIGTAAARLNEAASCAPQWAWLDDLSDGLEAADYAVGAADLPAASVGAPHIRHRIFFAAKRLVNGEFSGLEGLSGDGDGGHQSGRLDAHAGGSASTTGASCGLADRHSTGRVLKPERDREQVAGREAGECGLNGAGRGDACGLGDAKRLGPGRHTRTGARSQGGPSLRAERDDDRSSSAARRVGHNSRTHESHGGWQDADWLFCRDARWRPVEPSIQRVVDGFSEVVVPSGTELSASFPLTQEAHRRVMRLRGYGNAIIPQLAAEFVKGFVEACAEVEE
ncbi:MAG: DNA cytosine methyltransferase [Pseudomonadota bacterium]